MSHPTVVHWFRSDLRLGDHPSWHAAVTEAQTLGLPLLAVYVRHRAEASPTPWSPVRSGARRRAWLTSNLQALDAQLRQQGQSLLILEGTPAETLPALMSALHGVSLHAESWPAPEEQAQEQALLAQAGNWRLCLHAPSVLLPAASLPWAHHDVPDGFTPMRQAVEAQMAASGGPWPTPLEAPRDVPPPPPMSAGTLQGLNPTRGLSAQMRAPTGDPRSSFPFEAGAVQAGEHGAKAHLRHYLDRGLPHLYKTTRNQLIGLDFSSKWSPWLALGAISAPQLMHAVRQFEAEHGANEGSYWLWFELLWREHFRLMQHKHGLALYRWRGLCSANDARQRWRGNPRPWGPDSAPAHAWRHGETGQPLVDAGIVPQ